MKKKAEHGQRSVMSNLKHAGVSDIKIFACSAAWIPKPRVTCIQYTASIPLTLASHDRVRPVGTTIGSGYKIRSAC